MVMVEHMDEDERRNFDRVLTTPAHPNPTGSGPSAPAGSAAEAFRLMDVFKMAQG